MRDNIAYKLICFILSHIATKEYQALVNVTSGIGTYVMESQLEKIDQLSDSALYGKYLYDNWEEHKNG